MKPSGSDAVCKMYDSSADWYGEMMDSEIDLPVYSETLSRLHKKISDSSGLLIDTACGTGHMLSMYHHLFDQNRPLLGVDLSPRMVTIAKTKLGASARIDLGDMRDLSAVATGTAVAVVNFYALHHLDLEGIRTALDEWSRVLQPGGQLVIATWEGSGSIDYGDESDLIAVRYRLKEIESIVREASFEISRSVVEPVEGFSMDAIYLEGVRV